MTIGLDARGRGRPLARPPADVGILLPPALSGHCAVLTHHAYDPMAQPPDSQPDKPQPDQPQPDQPQPDQAQPDQAVPDDELEPNENARNEFVPAQIAAAREQVRAAFLTSVLDALLAAHADDSVDLRRLHAGARTPATLAAIADGAGLVVGPLLPPDPANGRAGSPSALLRASDGGYLPIEAHWHKATARRRPAEEDPRGNDSAQLPLRCARIGEPSPERAVADPGLVLRLGSREADFLALAQYRRVLQAAGFAAGTSWAAVIGTDLREGEPFLAWVDLDFPQVRTFSRSATQGWRLRSLLERHEHEHGFRIDVARAAAAGGCLVEPVVNRECASCPWWQTCRSRLDPGDISLRIEKGALDVREILTLRRLGVSTLDNLLEADLGRLLPRYLPEVRHRPDAEQRLRTAVRRAGMLSSGQVLQRDSAGPIVVPGAETEIDLDIETSADGHVYLWGFLVRDAGAEPRYVAFSRFTDLDDASELELAATALAWLRDQVESGDRRVYHYSGYEVAMIGALAARTDDPTLRWAAGYARTEFVDLLGVVAEHFFGASGLGLKQVARQAGFRWRDADPGGLNSQHWFADAVHGSTPSVRTRARQRVLDYNEDDVAATAALRAWLRAQ